MESINKAVKICGGQGILADRIGVTQSFVSQLVNGIRPVPATLCKQIEIATEGQVTCSDLRPDVFGVNPSTAA